jgi:hypothetical protein
MFEMYCWILIPKDPDNLKMADKFIDIKSGNDVNEDEVFTCKPGKFQ